VSGIWYEELREKYRPREIKLLLIGESPPDPRDKDRRFFYSPCLTRYDNLYRGVVAALLPSSDVRDKIGRLSELQRRGVWLIDTVDHPINGLRSSLRRRVLREAVPRLVERCKELLPRGIIICHGGVFSVASEPLMTAGLKLLHTQSVPFPLPYFRMRFVAGLQRAVQPWT
jgi:hypothetical protein